MENIETLLAAAAVAQTQGFCDDDAVVSSAPEPVSENPDSSPPADMPPKSAERAVGAGEKRKRGRPPKGKVSVKPPPPKRIKPGEEDEDVCFICFDGGSLILCDRKGCPKAYHPACIKRSEAFFKSKNKWNCGWHICGVCQKSSHYKCYTCTYSLCKGCTKDADYLLVRGNKGFCPICMKTIMLIENKDQANEVHVDFDDQASWEYLFKVYWVILKESLSLTLDELTQAKNRWKCATTIGYMPLSSNVVPTAVSVEVPTEHLEAKHVEANLPLPSNSNANHAETVENEKRVDGPTIPSTHVVMQETSVDKDTDIPGIEKHEDHMSTISHTHQRCLCKHIKEKEMEKMGISHGDSTEWATKALLEFVAHLKEGDTSAMSQFDVQTLLLNYVNGNNLWIAHRKNQIKCDAWLKKLFGKAGLSRVQMLKHLKSHFLVKEASQKESFIPGGFVGSVKSNIEVDESDNSGSDGKKDESGNPSHSGSPQNGRKPVSLDNEGKEERSIHIQNGIEEEKTDGGVLNNSDKHTNQFNITDSASDGGNDKKDMQSSGRETLTATASVGNSPSFNQVNITDSASDGGNDKKDMQSSGRETLTATASVRNSPSSNNLEVEKLWHYRDSDGKIRGPFSIMQLREWSTTGLYQPDMRIWTHHEHYDSLPLTEAVHGKLHGSSDLSNSGSLEGEARGVTWVLSEGTNTSGGDCKQIETPINTPVLAENSTKAARTDESGSWPQCWDFLKDNNFNNSSANDVQASDLLPSSNPKKRHNALPDCDRGSDSIGLAQNPTTSVCEVQNKSHTEYKAGLSSSEENPRSLDIDLMCSNYMGLSNNYMENISFSDPPVPTRPNAVPSDAPVQNSGILELLSPAPRSNDEDQAKNPGLMNLLEMQIPEIAEEWCKFSPNPVFSLRPPEITCEDIIATSHLVSNINEPIEFDALGEDSVSDLLAEVDAMESLGPLHSPTSYIKFARELLEDSKDDCFSSIEEFGSARRSDNKLCGTNVQSSSSEGETNHAGPDGVEPGWGRRVQGNINFVTVQGNVNLVIGGPGGGMTGLGWGSPNLNLGGSLPWDGQQRFVSGGEWGRGQWGRHSRSVTKGQRVCKFYGSGHCKKGAFCDYLHPHQ